MSDEQKVWVCRIKSGPMKGTATSWDGPASSAYIPYVPEPALSALQARNTRLVEALEKMIEPLPLDKNPKLTVSEAFDIFAARIGIGHAALKEEGK
jgi:hypothetical protein